MCADFVYLASLSPRRRDLLRQIGVSFRLLPASVDESVDEGEAAAAYVSRLALAKAEAGWRIGATDGTPVLAADTAVVVDGRILGKPCDARDAAQMLLRLSGRSHEVFTAVALRGGAGAESRISRSVVSFRRIGPDEAGGYWKTGEPRDKAGGYAVQGYGAIFITALHGSYSGVMGLPLFETAELLQTAGVRCWNPSSAGEHDGQ